MPDLPLPPVQEPPGLNAFAVLYWNHVGLEMNRVVHSLSGPQTGPTMSSRALGLLHLAMHDAFFGMLGHTQASDPPTYLPALPPLPGGAAGTLEEANAALTAAAVAVLDRLYVGTATNVAATAREAIEGELRALVRGYGPHIDLLSPAHRFGRRVAGLILDRLAVRPGEPGAEAGRYEPRQGRYFFRDEPSNPLRRVPIDPDHPERGTAARRAYHGPLYGRTARTFAVTDPKGHRLAPPPIPADPLDGTTTYAKALREVVRLGGAATLPGTTRTPDGTVAGLYWAYDGANLIGTPPRLYNQILRVLAWDRKATANPADQAQAAEFVRLFALANTAMADAGKFSWREKYRFEFWRPLPGVREHDTGGNPALIPDADPFWLSLGAPNTNTADIPFKPPFPAYPSGHATFGAACFQMARLFYKHRDGLGFGDGEPDALGFAFVSEELDGVSRDLRGPYDRTLPIDEQPGLVRTRVERRFASLWDAIWENAFSRIYLGVHWVFDAADPADVQADPAADDPVNKPADQIGYSNVWTAPRNPGDPLPTGGVPLGLGIANDIWGNAMKAPAAPGGADADDEMMGDAMMAAPPAAPPPGPAPLAEPSMALPEVQRSATPVR